MPVNPVLSKMKWRVASRLPGQQSWDKMKLVDQGLQPLNRSTEPSQVKGSPASPPPKVQSNPFLRNAWLRKQQRSFVPVPATKTSAVDSSFLKPPLMKTAVIPGLGFGLALRGLQGLGRAGKTMGSWFRRAKPLSAVDGVAGNAEKATGSWFTRAKPLSAVNGVAGNVEKATTNSLSAAEDLAARLGEGSGRHWSKLFRETAGPKAPFSGLTGQYMPGLYRMGAGSYIGSQFDSNEEGAPSYGAITGGLAGLLGPTALRKFLGNPNAAKGTLSKLFSSPEISRRLVNDPLHRVMFTAPMGGLFDAGMGALGYDTDGWGQRVGIGAGLAGGMRPWAQALGGRSQFLGNQMTALATRFPNQAQGLDKALTGGFGNTGALMFGSPYANANAGFLPLIGHGIIDQTIGARVRDLADKKKMLTDALNGPGMDSIKGAMEQTLQQHYGPEARFYDADGTPSRDAIALISYLMQTGAMNLQKAGQNYFGDPNYLLRPDNWERMANPVRNFMDMICGQATNLNPLPF